MRRVAGPADEPPPGRLFADLPPALVARLRRTAKVDDFAADEALFRQGEFADRAMVILAGVVRIWRASPSGPSLTVRLMRAGDTPGLVAAWRRVPLPANATAVESGRLLSWPIGLFQDEAAGAPALAANIVAAIGERIEEMLTRLHETAALGAEQRVARALLREADQTHGEIALTRLGLAELSATTLHTVSRLVSDWRRAGIVAAERGKIAILDRQALARRARIRPSLR